MPSNIIEPKMDEEEDYALFIHENYPQELLASLKRMYANSLYTDLLLISEDGVKYAVHKVVLCASTEFFAASHGPVVLNIPSPGLHTLIEFMYSGKLKLSEESARSLLEAAKLLRLTRGVQLCENYIRDLVTKYDNKKFSELLSQMEEYTCKSSAEPGGDVKHEPLFQPSEYETNMISPTVRRRRGRPPKVAAKFVTNQQPKRRGRPPKVKVAAQVGIHDSDPDEFKIRSVSEQTESAVVRKSKAGKSQERKQSLDVILKEADTIKRVPKSRNVSCNRCHRKFWLHSQLEYHIKTHTRYLSIKQKAMFKSAMRFVNVRPNIIHCETDVGKYICGSTGCKRVFKLYRSAKVHWCLTHSRQYSCSLCNETYRTKYLLKLHALKHHAISYLPKYSCNHCLVRPFLYESNLMRHVSAQHSRRKLRKTIRRNTNVSNKPKKTKVLKSNKVPLPSWPCTEDGCGEDFSSEFSLNKHVGRTHPDVNYQCPLCNYSSKLNCNLLNHLKKKHKRKSADVPICDMCNKSFCRPAQLARHKFSRHRIVNPSIKLYKCPVPACKYVAVHKIGLQKHQSRHNDAKPYACDLCQKTFKSEKSVVKHKNKTHFNIRPFICDQCGQAYGEAAELRTHIARHSHTKSFQCDMCAYSSHEKGNFKTHLYNRHGIKLDENMTTFECDLCAYTTDNKARFRDHTKSHNSVRDLPCPHCGKLFMTKKCLRGHEVKVHNPKTLTCDFCGYATADKSKLTGHMKVMHTQRGFKPYKCAYCDFHCATGGNCRKHVANKHKGLEVKYVKLDLRPHELSMPDPEAVQLETLAGRADGKVIAVGGAAQELMADFDMSGAQVLPAASVTLTNENVASLGNSAHTVMLSGIQSNIPVMNIVQGGQNYEILHTFLGQGITM